VTAALAALPLWVKAVVLGIVEGVTEFIPVSSTGHLIIAGDWLGWTTAQAGTFEVFIQLGAILAILWLYRARLTGAVRRAASEPASRRFVLSILIAFLPASVVGLLAHSYIKAHLFRVEVVAAALVAGGIAILLIERLRPRVRIENAERVPLGTALGIGLVRSGEGRYRVVLIGLAQVLALIPGTSRSGATILGAYCLGLSRPAAAEFSFFLAIPVMLAATLFDLYKSRAILDAGDFPVFAIGFVVAFASALVVVRAFLGFVSRHSFAAFAWYRIGFGLLLLLLYRGGAT
jgi:undecaprenyl-diphosphatase